MATKEKDVFDAVVEEDAPEEPVEMDFSYPPVHTMIRTISRNGQSDGQNFFNITEVDAHVGAWIAQGYELRDTHFIGEDVEGWMVMYVLTRTA